MINKNKLSAEILQKYSLNEEKQYFRLVAKENPKDKIEVEIGDSKDASNIFPQVKIQRWDNEVNCSVRLKDFDNYSVSSDKEKIKLINGKKEVYLYEISPCEGHKEGGFEFEVILKEKPVSNVIEFSLVDKDVEYFYQRKLTQEEKDKGARRPENVIGSYAVYAKSNKVNYVNGKEYKCGKVGHIFRPKIIDSVGTEVWGKLHIENGILSVTIPQEFLDKAIYPIRHASGLLFGYDTLGSSNWGDEGYISGALFIGANGKVDSITFGYVGSDYKNQFGKSAIYKHSDLSLQASSEVNTYLVSNEAERWITTTGYNNFSVSAIEYVLTGWGTGTIDLMFDDGDTDQGHQQDLEFNGWPNPLVPTHNDAKYSIYCTYQSGRLIIEAVSNKDGGFENLDDGEDTDPFTSEEQIGFTVQPGEELAPGTYFWRVRGVDPEGVNEYGEWSSTRSFANDQKALSDSQSISESLASKVDYKKALSDSIAFAEAHVKAIGLPALADTHSIGESVANKSTLGVSDAITFAESKTTFSEFKKSLADTLSIDEALAKGMATVLADTHEPTEALAKTITLALTDEITFAEAPVAVNEFYRSLSDTLSIADAEIEEIVKVLTDAISIAEALANKTTLSLSDAHGIEESLATTNVFKRSLSDEITFADAEIEEFVKTLSDTLSISEALASGVGKVISDTHSISESLVAGFDSERNLSDSLGIAETIGKIAVEKSLTESVSLAESVANLGSLRLSDSISISESIVHAWVAKTSLADTLGIAEALSLGAGKGLTDEITFAEGISKFAVGQGLSDSLVLADSLARTVDYVRSLSDEHFIADGTGKDVEIALSDSMGIGEAVSLEPQPRPSDEITLVEAIDLFDVGKKPSDTLSFAEATAKAVEKTIVDNIVIEEVISAREIVKSLSDSITFAEGLSAETFLGVSPSDSLIITESLAFTISKVLLDTFDLFDEVVKGVTLPLTDAVDITESLAKDIVLSLSDVIPIIESEIEVTELSFSDSISFVESLAKDIVKSFSDSVSIAESERKDIIVPFTESVPISEAVGSSIGFSVSDSISIVESLALVNKFYRTPVDSQSIAESEVKAIVKVLVDSITLSDSEVEKEVEHLEDSAQPFLEEIAKSIVKNLTETLSIADSEAGAIGLPLADSISISEAVAYVSDFKRSLADSVAFSESIDKKSIGVGLVESLSIAETLANDTTLSLSDSITITESETEAVGIAGLADSLSISEGITKKAIVKNLTESLSLADSEVEAVTFHLTFSDSISIAEESYRNLFLIKSDSITFADSLLAVFILEFSESVSISESLVKFAEFYRSLTETVSLSDAPGITIDLPFSDSISISESSIREIGKGLSDSVLFVEELTTDVIPTERIAQPAFLRTGYW